MADFFVPKLRTLWALVPKTGTIHVRTQPDMTRYRANIG